MFVQYTINNLPGAVPGVCVVWDFCFGIGECEGECLKETDPNGSLFGECKMSGLTLSAGSGNDECFKFSH